MSQFLLGTLVAALAGIDQQPNAHIKQVTTQLVASGLDVTFAFVVAACGRVSLRTRCLPG